MDCYRHADGKPRPITSTRRAAHSFVLIPFARPSVQPPPTVLKGLQSIVVASPRFVGRTGSQQSRHCRQEFR
jgi:hypothetical protein